MPLYNETNLDVLKRNLDTIARSTHSLAAQMRQANAWLWNLPTAELLAVLNADVPFTTALFTANTVFGAAVNDSLDLYGNPRLPARVPVVAGRADIAFNPETVLWELVPPVEPEP